MTRTDDRIDPREVEPFDATSYRAAFTTTAANRVWLADCARRGVSGAWFHGIPHVLSPGPVSLESARVMSWREAP